MYLYLHNGKDFSYTEWLRLAIHLSGWMNKKIVLSIIHIFFKMGFYELWKKKCSEAASVQGSVMWELIIFLLIKAENRPHTEQK